MKITKVALKANKSSKQGTSSKANDSKQASTNKPKETQQVQQNVDTSSSSTEDKDYGADFKEIIIWHCS
jgi:hypothetical protein